MRVRADYVLSVHTPALSLSHSLPHTLSPSISDLHLHLFPLSLTLSLSLRSADVQAITFEGAKIMLNKGLSNHFQVSHTINMSTTVPSGYRFGATYVGTKQYSPTEAFPVLLGDIDPSGNLNANVIHQFSSRLRCKFASQVSSRMRLRLPWPGD